VASVINTIYSIRQARTLQTTGLKKSSRTKAKLYKRWISTREKEDELLYKQYRKVFKTVSLECEASYYKTMFDTKSNTVKQL